MNATLKTLGEFGLIARLTRALGPQPHLSLGIGDDAAAFAIPEGEEALVTTDLLVENVHFRLKTTGPEDLGHKALAVNLSDIAAMGARPLAAFLSLALPADLPLAFLDAFYAGLAEEAKTASVAIAGGDTTRSPGPLVINVALVGASRGGRYLRRDGARPGDSLWVVGALGCSRAGLLALEAGERASATLLNAHRRPRALLAEGAALLASGRVTAALDVSDGLLGDATRLAEASGVAVVIETERLPLTPALKTFAATRGLDPRELALKGGEDYALLFTQAGDAPPAPWPRGLGKPVRIGRIAKGHGLRLLDDAGRPLPAACGYDHFAVSAPKAVRAARRKP